MQSHKSAVRQKSFYQAEARASLPVGEDVGIFPVIFHLSSLCPTAGSLLQLGSLQKGHQNLAKKRRVIARTSGISFPNSDRNLLKHWGNPEEMIWAEENITSYDTATPVLNAAHLFVLSWESRHALSFTLSLNLRCLPLFAACSMAL